MLGTSLLELRYLEQEHLTLVLKTLVLKELSHTQTKNQILEWHLLHVQHLQKLVIGIIILIYFTSIYFSMSITSIDLL